MSKKYEVELRRGVNEPTHGIIYRTKIRRGWKENRIVGIVKFANPVAARVFKNDLIQMQLKPEKAVNA
jgi:hypothetical protein